MSILISDLDSDRVVHDRYRVVCCIGRGGMGAVYEAIDERLGIRVALKESFAIEDELRIQFEREARLLAGLRHSGLPRVTDYFIENGHAFLVMEFVEGATLAQVLVSEGKPFSSTQVIKWADQILDVLVYLHGRDRQVIHRDIKPHNLKLTSSGAVCLIDFGLAKGRLDEGRSVHGFSRRYSPLEQIEDRGTTEQSDIYALGATLYHLLTGVKPADAEVRATVVAAGGEDPLVLANELLPAIGGELLGILGKALAQSPDERFATASEFREALGRVGRTESGDPVEDSRRHWAPRRWAMAACLVLAAAVVCLVMVVTRVNPSEVVNGAAQVELASAAVKAEKGGASKAPVEMKRRSVERPVPKSVSPEKVGAADRAARLRDRPVMAQVHFEAKRKVEGRANVLPVRSDEVLRAPDGTEIVKFRDGRVRAFQSGERKP